MEQENMQVAVKAIGEDQIKTFVQVLQKYKTGKARTEQRILSSENWWKLRNDTEEKKENLAKGLGFKSRSGWLHNVIVSKHADAIEAYPEPNILPREKGDKAEARKLSAIIPCVLEQNQFEATYSEAMWQKMKTGTGAYKVVWDQGKLNGLGDIGIERVNLLNIYWEPGVTNIQKSRYFFHTELVDKELLQQKYPELEGKLRGSGFISTKFLYDDAVDTSEKATVIDVYYHKVVDGRMTVQYCKFVDNVVLYATENDVQAAQTGLYDHGKYPYVLDPLFPIEGSPCGYGYVDLCRNPQTQIDLLETAFVKNARVGAMPRYFSRVDGNVNEEVFLDLERALVPVSGNVDEASLRRIEHTPLDGNYINLMDKTIEQLRQTSGNTEASTGTATSGVTAASAIAALQEASGKGSRDATMASYRAFTQIVDMVIELIRQFYDQPRQFRILGQYGMEQYISYTNAAIKPQHQGNDFGQDMGYRLPVFDIKVSAQKKSVYTKVSQNELALQFFQLGFFNPHMTDQALMCLEMMDFDEKDTIMQKVSQNGTMFQKLVTYMQMAMQFAPPQIQQTIYQDMAQLVGNEAAAGMLPAKLTQADNVTGLEKKEHGRVTNARTNAQNASQPEGAKVKGE